MDTAKQVARTHDIATKVARLYGKRTKLAQEHFGERLSNAYADCAAGLSAKPVAPLSKFLFIIIPWSRKGVKA